MTRRFLLRAFSLPVRFVAAGALLSGLVVALGTSTASALICPAYVNSTSGLNTALGTCSTIYVAQGIYIGNFTPSGGARVITIIGAGEGMTFLNGGGTGTVFTNPSGYTVTLMNLTITDGTSSASPGAGGVVNKSGGTMTLQDVNVTSNSETAGSGNVSGGVYSAGPLSATSLSVLRNNGGSSPDCAGGIINDGAATMTLSSSIVSQNMCSGTFGTGGVANYANLDIYQSTLTNNAATGSEATGGGVYDGASDKLYMSGVSITGNSASGPTFGGGGVNIDGGGTVTILGGLIANNSALHGGGVYLYTSATLNMSGSAGVVHNSASIDGGGFYNNGGTENIAPSVTVNGNQPDNFAP